MCTLSKTNRLKTAKTDIYVYKRISCGFGKSGKLYAYTPYQWVTVPIDVLLGKEAFTTDIKLESRRILGGYIILGGVIHTYAFARDAYEHQCHDEIVIEFIIPKGTKYIEGFNEWNNKTICAKSIRIAEPFKDENEIKGFVTCGLR